LSCLREVIPVPSTVVTFRSVLLAWLLAWAGVAAALGQTATFTASSNALNPAGGTVVFSFASSYSGTALYTLNVALPAGWRYLSGTGEPSFKPEPNAESQPGSPLSWLNQAPSAGPVAFSFTVSYPAGLTTATVTPGFVFRQNGQRVDVTPPPIVFGSAPVIGTHPTSQTVGAGSNVTFGVAATGSATLTYQWRKDSVPLAGATAATLSLTGVSAANVGAYTVVVSNDLGSVTSNAASLSLASAPPSGGGGGGGGGVVIPPPSPNPSAPVIVQQPTGRSIFVGQSTTFTVVADTPVTSGGDGTPRFTYQWRKDATALAGATNASYTISAAALADAGTYTVVVTNSAGSATSAGAKLEVTVAPAFAIVTPPVSQTVDEGARAAFTVVASGVGPITYQWRKNSVAIPGATSATFTLAAATATDAGNYTVVVTQPGTTALTSVAATLTVRPAVYAGSYFGSFASGGAFALLVRSNQTGVFLGYATGSQTAFVARDVSVDSAGRLHFTTLASTSSSAVVAAAAVEYVVDATLTSTGTLTGSVAGLTALNATRSASTGVAQSVAGFYQAGAANSSSTSYAIVSPAGQAFVLTVAPTATDAGTGTVDATGRLAVTTGSRATITGMLAAATLTASVTTATGEKTDFLGGSDTRIATEKLLNIATRGAVGGAAGEMIAGFVIRGSAPKSVLIRAVGPALGAFGVAGALPAARLELFGGSPALSLATNNGWGNSTAVAAAAARSGAFALTPNSRDASILISLAPGPYTVVVSGDAGASGVALVEVYDASENTAPDQKVVNIASRGNAGSGDNTLTAGFVIAGSIPKRVLIRGVGPALGAFGVPGTLADPELKLINQSGTVIVTNDNWGAPVGAGAADTSQIAAVATAVGAFAYAPGSKDAALLLNLAPGPYTVQLSGAGGTTGAALVEVYEVP